MRGKFVGKDALKKIAEEGTNNRLHGFELLDSSMGDPSIEKKAKVEKDGEEVGYVTTLTYGFSVDKFIGYAVVDKTKAKKGDTVTINGHEAKLTDRMFYDTDNERLTK